MLFITVQEVFKDNSSSRIATDMYVTEKCLPAFILALNAELAEFKKTYYPPESSSGARVYAVILSVYEMGDWSSMAQFDHSLQHLSVKRLKCEENSLSEEKKVGIEKYV